MKSTLCKISGISCNMSPYKNLQDSFAPNKKNHIRIGVLALAVVGLLVMGVVLAIAVLERPSSQEHIQAAVTLEENHVPKQESRILLVESLPLYLQYGVNATFGLSLEKAWKHLLSMATEQVAVASFYWTLTGEDINVNTTTDQSVSLEGQLTVPFLSIARVFQLVNSHVSLCDDDACAWPQGRALLEQFGDLPSRNVSVRVVISNPTLSSNSTDLQYLRNKGVQVRRVDFGRLTGGVLHTKFWIVDRKHIYIGSANMDWRSLSQVKELGVVIHNCSRLAEDLHKIFSSYWVMGHTGSSLPIRWPAKYRTNINQDRPLLVKTETTSNMIYMAASPPVFCPHSRTQDLDAILTIISEAERYIHVAVMAYFPTTQFQYPSRYWPAIDDALRKAAIERNVKVRMLISCGQDSDPVMLPFLQSLSALHAPRQNIHIQVKLYIVPVANQTGIPHARVNHNKYMVTDKVAYIGTSNWSEDYFYNTAGVGLVVSTLRAPPRAGADQGLQGAAGADQGLQGAPGADQGLQGAAGADQGLRGAAGADQGLQGQLWAVFDRDWHSQFAVELDALGSNPDCALSEGPEI